MKRRAARVDRNHAEIREALRRAGVAVVDTHDLGKGFVDLVAVHRHTGHAVLLEVKDGSLSPSRRRLTPDEEKIASLLPVVVVTSVAEALRACGIEVAR